MEFVVYKDIASIAFVRCMSPISGSRSYAEGVGFSISTATAKCKSERIEREFCLEQGPQFQCLGIAAHPNFERSVENAYLESLEVLAVQKVQDSKIFQGFALSLLNKAKIYFGKVNNSYFNIVVANLNGNAFGISSVAKNPIRCQLKSWVEFRNITLLRPNAEELKYYTLPNKIIGTENLTVIRATNKFQDMKMIIGEEMRVHSHRRENHFVSYFTHKRG